MHFDEEWKLASHPRVPPRSEADTSGITVTERAMTDTEWALFELYRSARIVGARRTPGRATWLTDRARDLA